MLLNLEAAQDASDEGRVQIDRVAGLNRLVGDRLNRHGSARIFKRVLAGCGGRAAGGAEEIERGQEKRTAVKCSFSPMVLQRRHRWGECSTAAMSSSGKSGTTSPQSG